MIMGLRVLVLAPHTDDGEFGCGGTLARLVEAGSDVFYAAFSTAVRSLPPELPEETLELEMRSATAALDIPAENLRVYDFDVRTFPQFRQEILEELVILHRELAPDVVLLPTLGDIHQDHSTVAREGQRAFKRTTMLGYQLPWNSFEFRYQAYVRLEQRHLDAKIDAIACYESQRHREYADEGYIRGLARTHGIVSGKGLAEAFEIYRWMI